MRGALLLASLAACVAAAACGGEAPEQPESSDARVLAVVAGDVWSLPAWVRASSGTGLFSEDATPALGVHLRSVDLTWRQAVPQPGVFRTDAAGHAQDLDLPSYRAQRREAGPFWMRLFASGVDWAPPGIATACGVQPLGPDDDGQLHLPIWDPCVWGRLRDAYRTIFLDAGLRADPELRFVYVPGAFTWSEFDFDLVSQAARRGLTQREFTTWFRQAMRDLVEIFGPYAHKLVYTGEDYPFGPFGTGDDLLAREAVELGLGIRTGIPETFNFHLSDVPAYGARIARDGHVRTDERWPLLDGRRVVATEIECVDACGYETRDAAYALRLSVLKSLQLRATWLYVVPEESRLRELAPLWRWARLSLGKGRATSPDAWVALRDAEDRYWLDDEAVRWPRRPWVRNLERWLVQRDVAPDGRARRGTDVRRGEVAEENGTAYEGLRTDVAHGQRSLYLDLDDGFRLPRGGPLLVHVTFLDRGRGAWHLRYDRAGAPGRSPSVQRRASGDWRTATIRLDDAALAGGLAGRTDLRLVAEQGDLEVRFVRVVSLRPRG